jgi:uncharacterized protein
VAVKATVWFFYKGKSFVPNGISITWSSDGLQAFAMVLSQREHSYPSCQELLDALSAAHILIGINNQALLDMVSAKTINNRVEVAKGIPAEPGIAGRIEMLVDVSSVGKPKLLSDNRADYHDISYVINVRKGDRLARRIQPILGKEGKTVQGMPIVPPLPMDVRLPAGWGTAVSTSDPDLLVAEIDGGITIISDGTIEVHKEETIVGDIDYKTGDVRFTGDLRVTGSIRAGFSVETKGNLFISGSVEDSTIKCKGTVVVNRGAVGAGSGCIDCAGAFKARHLENFKVTAGAEVKISEDVVNAMVDAAGVVYAKTIRGGSIASLLGVEAGEIGTSGEIKTVVDIGKKYERIQARYKLLSKLASLVTEMEKNRELVFQFVRDNMDTSGALSLEHEKMLSAMKIKTAEMLSTLEATQVEIEKLDALKSESTDPYIKAEVIYPNTVVKFGIGEQLIRERLKRVRLAPVEKGSTVTLTQEIIEQGER